MKTILLIEDNEDMRENTTEILELYDYEVISAENGAEGIELATISAPDLIISDITMPKLDGFEMVEALRKNELLKNTPVIFITARAEKDYTIRATELKVDFYITKPYDGDELLKIINQILIR